MEAHRTTALRMVASSFVITAAVLIALHLLLN